MSKILSLKDNVLEEIHSIQREHYGRYKNFTFTEYKRYLDARVSKLQKEHRIKFKILTQEDMFVISK